MNNDSTGNDEWVDAVTNNGHSPLVADAYGREYELAAAEMTLDELRERAGELNINLYTPGQRQRIDDLRQNAQQRAAATNRGKWAKRGHAIMAISRAAVQGLAQWSTLVVTLIASYLFLPLSVFGLAVAEYQRVAAGVRQFDPARANLMALVAVATYTLLLFIQAQMLHEQPDYKRPAWSARLTGDRLLYWLGWRIGGDWEPRYKTRYDMLRSTIAFLSGMIVLLGTVGALESEIAAHAGKAWTQALQDIATESELSTFLNWIGGGLLTLALLSAAHFTSVLTYDRFADLGIGGADFFTASENYLAEADQAERLYLLSLINRKEQRQQSG